MDASLSGGVVRAGPQARERFYDSRGYGRPVDGGDLELAPVEAAHLLARGDLAAVDGMDFPTFLSSAAVSEVAFFVYADLRDRGFYLASIGLRPAVASIGADTANTTPTANDTPSANATPTANDTPSDSTGSDADFAVFPRGKGPWDGEIAYTVRVVGERTDVPASALGETVLAIVDEESEITYLETGRPEMTGTSEGAVSPTDGDLLEDRVICWDPPADLYESAFYGQRLHADAVQLSLVEAAYLARTGTLTVDGGADRLVGRGRDVEGERFDRRLTVYGTLRDAGLVPKTGFKFGADFRTYAAVESVNDLGHSERLVRVLPSAHRLEPRNLALDVRLAHGVRKTMTFALVDDGTVSWIEVERLTP